MLPTKAEKLVPKQVWATTEWTPHVDNSLKPLPVHDREMPENWRTNGQLIYVLTHQGEQYVAIPLMIADADHDEVDWVWNIINLGIFTAETVIAWRPLPSTPEPPYDNRVRT